jgi:hypothetical protein
MSDRIAGFLADRDGSEHLLLDQLKRQPPVEIVE